MLDSYQPHQFGSTHSHSRLLRHFLFEARAVVGRSLSPRRRRAKQPLLQIGSGLNPLPQFENLDFYFAHRGKAKHVGHDVRRALPYEDNTFEGAFSEHTLEHLYPADAMKLLKEVHRVLRPGAVFRVSVPDLGKYISFYSGSAPNAEFGQFSSGCEAIWNLTQNWEHRSVWDATWLCAKLLEAGFSRAKERTFLDGDDERLLVDLADRSWESLYVEAVK